MKREIEVWVYDIESINSNGGATSTIRNFNNPNDKWHKAVLTIEEPEPEVTITPSKLREVFNKSDKVTVTYEAFLEDMIKELFGDKE